MAQQHVVIAVCTRNRPIMLEKCLRSLIHQHIDKDFTCSILVVENNNHSFSQPIIDKLEQESLYPIHYCLETNHGISYARNRVLKESLALHCQWLLLIDDDEVADKNWAREMLQAAHEFSADVIHGTVMYQNAGKDSWTYLFRKNQKIKAHGKKVHGAATDNVLISSRLFSPHGLSLQFDEQLNFSGGEDTDFFRRANVLGATIFFSARAVVFDDIHSDRCSLTYLLARRARTAAAAVYSDKKIHGANTARKKHLKRSRRNVKQFFQLLLSAVVFSLINPEKSREKFLASALHLASYYGSFLGLRNKLLLSYKTTDGN